MSGRCPKALDSQEFGPELGSRDGGGKEIRKEYIKVRTHTNKKARSWDVARVRQKLTREDESWLRKQPSTHTDYLRQNGTSKASLDTQLTY